MSPRRSMTRAVRVLVRLAALGLVVGLVVAAVLPGGLVDLGPVDDLAGGSDALGTATPAGTGATATPPDRPQGESPWGKEVLTVAVRNRADPSRNVTGAVADALAYWSTNAGYADYPAEFRLRPDAASPDVVVWYNASIQCANHDDAIGCAPLLAPSRPVEPPVHVQIRHDPAHNRREVGNTAIHELGHVLGITHCEEPYWVMAPACPGPIPDAPDADERDLAWRDGTISVHVDESNVSADDLEGTRDQLGHALAYIEEGRAEEFPGDVTFVRAGNRFDADVTIAFRRELPCGDEAVVCTSHRGRDYDGDGRLEYHTGAIASIDAASDVDARGWYAGWGLATVLAPGHVPPVFENASYRERRSEWWE